MIEKISHLNAIRFFRFDDMFKNFKREELTVGALRAKAKAKGVDVTPKSSGGARPSESFRRYGLRRLEAPTMGISGASRLKLIRVQFDDSVRHFSFRATPSDVFAAAAIELCTRLWVELDHCQRGWLDTIIREVLASLDDSADELPGYQSITRAQNRLLMAVLEQCADHSEELVEIPVFAATS